MRALIVLILMVAAAPAVAAESLLVEACEVVAKTLPFERIVLGTPTQSHRLVEIPASGDQRFTKIVCYFRALDDRVPELVDFGTATDAGEALAGPEPTKSANAAIWKHFTER